MWQFGGLLPFFGIFPSSIMVWTGKEIMPSGGLIYINITVSYCRILTLKFSLKFIHHAGAEAAAAGK